MPSFRRPNAAPARDRARYISREPSSSCATSREALRQAQRPKKGAALADSSVGRLNRPGNFSTRWRRRPRSALHKAWCPYPRDGPARPRTGCPCVGGQLCRPSLARWDVIDTRLDQVLPPSWSARRTVSVGPAPWRAPPSWRSRCDRADDDGFSRYRDADRWW